MADIFISYAHENVQTAKALAQALADEGWEVWWDPQIRSGTQFPEIISRQLTTARCVISLWSEAALRSRWVRDESEEALKRYVLVPVRIEAIVPPLGFRTVQTADLIGWKGDRTDLHFAHLIADIRSILDKTSPNDHDIIPEAQSGVIKCPYCNTHIKPNAPTDASGARLEQVIALPYARDVDIFNPGEDDLHSEWTKIGQDFFRFVNYERIGILHMENDWRIQYCVARCPNQDCQGLMDVFANFTTDHLLSEMWPHLLTRHTTDIQHNDLLAQLFQLPRNTFFILLSLFLAFTCSITPSYFQQARFRQFLVDNSQIIFIDILMVFSITLLFFTRNKLLQLFKDERRFSHLFKVKTGLVYWSNFAVSRYMGYRKNERPSINAVMVFGGLPSSIILFITWILARSGILAANISQSHYAMFAELGFWLVISYLFGKLVWTMSVMPHYVLGGIKYIPMDLTPADDFRNLDIIKEICTNSMHAIYMLVITVIVLSTLVLLWTFPMYVWIMLWAQLTIMFWFGVIILRFFVKPAAGIITKCVEIMRIIGVIALYVFVRHLMKVFDTPEAYTDAFGFGVLCACLFGELGTKISKSLIDVEKGYIDKAIGRQYERRKAKYNDKERLEGDMEQLRSEEDRKTRDRIHEEIEEINRDIDKLDRDIDKLKKRPIKGMAMHTRVQVVAVLTAFTPAIVYATVVYIAPVFKI